MIVSKVLHSRLLQLCFQPDDTKDQEAILTEWAERLLLAELTKHLNPREYFVMVSWSRGESLSKIAKVLGMVESAVRSAKFSAEKKIGQPWRLAQLRRRLQLREIIPDPTDPIEFWLEVNPILVGIFKKQEIVSLEDLTKATATWWTRYTLQPHNELELHRIISAAHSMCKKK